RCFELAGRVGTKLEQLYLLPSGRGRLVNAFASSGNLVLLSELLVRKLTRREVDAVVAHELGHLAEKHVKKARGCLGFILLAVFGTGLLVLAAKMGWHKWVDLERWWFPAVGVPILLVITLGTYRTRRWERVADAAAVRLTGDPEALITGLAKVS